MLFSLGFTALRSLFMPLAGASAAVGAGAVAAHKLTDGKSTQAATNWAGRKLTESFEKVVPDGLKDFTRGIRDFAQNNPGMAKMGIAVGSALLAYGAIGAAMDESTESSGLGKVARIAAALAIGWMVTSLASKALDLDKPKPAAVPLTPAPSAS